MKIKESVLKMLDNNRGYALVMDALDVSFSSARFYIKKNTDDLTKAAVLEKVRNRFNLTDDEILEREVEKA